MFDESELKTIIIEQQKKYPQLQISDMLKLLYQNEFGCGHMVSDKQHSLNIIIEEIETLSESALNGDIYEYIGNNLCRLHLRVLRQSSLSPETLNNFFLLTANQPMGSAEGYEEKAAILVKLCENGAFPYNAAEVLQAISESRAARHPAQRHSTQYRSAYAPAYRVVNKAFCDFLPLFSNIDKKAQTEKCVTVAIGRNKAVGKSTLADLLKQVYSSNILITDE